MPTKLDDHSIRLFLNEHRFALVLFWAPWSGYDRQMIDLIERIEPDFAGRLGFGLLDVDPPEHHAIATEYGVRSVPFFCYFGDGVLKKSEVGCLTEIELRRKLDELSGWITPPFWSP